jgi:Conserved TM helix
MTDFAQMFSSVGASVSPFLPKVGAALVIVVAAWLGARLARLAVEKAGNAYGLDTRLSSTGLTASLAGVVGSLVWLLALPALLGVLELNGLLTPVNAMLSRLMAFVPNLMGAAVVLGIGLLVARIGRQVVTGLMRAAGSERVAEKLGMAGALGEAGLAGMAGNMVFALLLLPILVAALTPLGLDALTTPLSKLLETLLNFVPRLMAAAIVIAIAVVLGRMLSTLISALLSGMGLDKQLQKLGVAELPLGGRSLSDLVGTALMLAVVVTGITQASEILQMPVLTQAVAGLGLTLLHAAVAAVILLLGYVLASAAANALLKSNNPKAHALAGVARVAILFFAAALALHQAGLPAIIVTIAFAAVVGAIAVGVALAVGLGGAPVATRALERLAHKVAPEPTAQTDLAAAAAQPPVAPPPAAAP